MALLLNLLRLYELALFIRIILSWIPHNHFHPAAQFLYKITEPVLGPARRLIPPVGGFDISPIIVFIGIEVL
ncbi:MAG: YggT family protein, partial [Planctomycetes bacterium]|nr:YggT family protein [Planctomycetota bacterium]